MAATTRTSCDVGTLWLPTLPACDFCLSPGVSYTRAVKEERAATRLTATGNRRSEGPTAMTRVRQGTHQG